MKNLVVITLCFASSLLFAQKNINLESVIPNSVGMVLKINGKQITNKVGLKNINKSDAFLKMIEGEIFLGNENKRISDIGINLGNDVYMVYESGENIRYTAYLYHIQKPKLFARYIAEKNEFVETTKSDDYTVILYKKSDHYYDHTRDFLAWNGQYAIYFDVTYVKNYVEEITDEVEIYDESYYEEEVMEAIEEPEPVEESVPDNSVDYYKEREAERLAYQRRRDSIQKVRELEKEAIIMGHYKNELNRYFGASVNANSILSSEDYTSGKNEKADVSLWMALGKKGVFFNPMRGYYGRWYDFPEMLGAYMGMYAGKGWNTHLFFNKSDISIESDLEFTPETGQLLAGVYNSTLPKSYLKYISNEKVLGITGASLNATKFWETFPKIYADALMFGGSTSKRAEKRREGIKVLVDFLSIMMDEEALGKLMNGNAVFVLKDLIPTEVEYYTYEYNEDYSESKRVKKTKTEVYPDFLLMFGSENKEFMTKLLELACKNEVIYKKGNYYFSKGDDRDFPFKMYFALTDDMAFISTNQNEIENLANGKTTGNLDKKLANKLTSNTSYFNLDLSELLSRIPQEKLSNRELKTLNYFKENSGVIEWINNFENGKSVTKMQMNTPEKFNNSALFIWDLIETAEEF